MKITIFIIALATMQTFAFDNYAQTKRMDVKIEQSTIVSALEKIEAQSEFFFFYNNKVVRLDKKVSVDLKEKTINEILDVLFKDTDIEYTINNRQIILSGKEEDSQLNQQQKSVNGKVTDSAGAPIPGATVLVKGTTTGVTTDNDGNFSLSLPSAAKTLIFSFVGMKSQEVEIGNKNSFKVILSEESIGLEEVVAIGYGTQKKATLSGSIGTASEKAFVDRPAPNAMASLQGEIAGLNIVKTTGKPGNEGWRFNIRGFSSNRQLDPLVVIDGVPMPTSEELQRMNSNDIESVSVLKDGSASIYGSRAAGGVILVTTKKAKQEKTTITYSGTSTLQTVGIHFKVMDRKNWFSSNEIAMNNQSAAFPFEGLKAYYMGDKSDYVLLRNDPAVAAAVGGAFSDVADFGVFDTDWFKVMFGNIHSQNHSLSMSGASKNTNYLVSLGYNDQSSPLKWGKMGDARYNGRLNLETKLAKNFTSRSKLSYERENYIEPSTVDGVIGSIWGEQPGMPSQSIDGKAYAWGGQGALNWTLKNGGDYHQHYSRINMVQAFDYNPIQTEKDNLTITGQLGINDWNYRDDKFTQPVNYYDYSGTLLVRTAPTQNTTTMTRNWNSLLYQSYQLFANYKTKFLRNNDVNLMLGTSFETSRKDYIAAYRKNLSVAGLATLNIGDPATATNSDLVEQWGIASYFGRLNYAYKGKYLLEGNFRYDGSSRFTPSNRWGVFGGGSAAWRISEESFLKNSNIFQDLKIRASYGTTGNQEGIGLYDYVSRLGVSSYPFGITATNYQTTPAGGLVSLNRTWETLGIKNIGLDFAILNNKLSGSVDLFKKKNDGMLIGITYPSVLGGNAPSTNSGTVETKGYEITLSWRDKIGKDFSYNITASFSDNKSMMTYLGGPAILGRGIKSFVQGYSPYTIFGYKTDGIIQNETELAAIKTRFKNGGLPSNWGVGCVKIIDKNGDGILSEGGDVYDLGSTEPRYGFSLNLGMRWKGFDFSAFLQGYGKVMGYSQRSAEAFDAWYINESSYFVGKTALVGDDPSNPGHKIVLNPEAKYALTGVQTSLNYLYNDLSVHDYGYVRLKQISLGYTIPEKWCNKIKIQGLRIFVSGNDIWEWVKRKDGFDPESDWRNAQSNNYPAMRSWSVGVNLNF